MSECGMHPKTVSLGVFQSDIAVDIAFLIEPCLNGSLQ